MKPEEKIEQAYEELRSIIDGGSESFTHEDAVQYLKDKLAQPEQKPVAWMNPYGGVSLRLFTGLEKNSYTIPLYTTPPRRTWVGLTPDEIRGISLASGESLFSAIMFTHDTLKEKNK